MCNGVNMVNEFRIVEKFKICLSSIKDINLLQYRYRGCYKNIQKCQSISDIISI